MTQLFDLRRACASLLKPLALTAALIIAPPAMAQSEFRYGYDGDSRVFQDIVDDLIKACHDDVETFISRTLAAPDYNGNGQGYGTITAQQADLTRDGRFDRKDPVVIINSEMIMWLVDIRTPAGVSTIRNSLAFKERTLTGAGYVDANVLQTHRARLDVTRCLYKRRIEQLQGTSLVGNTPTRSAAPATSGASSASAAAPAPAASSAAPPYPNSKLGPETQKALSDIMAPNARAGKSFFDTVDFKALAEGRPSNPASKQDQATANSNYRATKSRKLHNSLNDVTPCLAVDPTGVREEWGIEGRFRIRNTCSFPVEASWCANKRECASGQGSTWQLKPKGVWPIFFADLTNPQIGIGGCRTEENRIPLPANAAGGINESHKPPIPYPGVTIMPGHRCD